MKQEVWSQADVKDLTAKFTVVDLDSDRYSTKPLMNQYGVRGIPVTLLLDCQGRELDRVMDYVPKTEMIKDLARWASSDLQPKSVLEARAEGGDKGAALALALNAARSYVPSEAMRWFGKLPDREKYIEYWQIATSQPPQTEEVYRKAIAAFPKTLSSLEWRSELAHLQGITTDAGKARLREIVDLADEAIAHPATQADWWKDDPQGDEVGIEPLHFYSAKAEALGDLGKAREARDAWHEGVKEGDRLKIRDEATGPFYRFLPILVRAGEKSRIDHFFERQLKLSPNDGELLRRYSKVLFMEGQFQKAAATAHRAVRTSYDENEVMAAVIEADSLAKLRRPKEAREILLRELSRSQLAEATRDNLKAHLAKVAE